MAHNEAQGDFCAPVRDWLDIAYSDHSIRLVIIANMPHRKRSVRALQMNVKRWRKEKDECEVIENSNVQNVRMEKLNTVVKKDASAVGNYILVNFNQVNNLLRSAKC
ncbi:uncharacterized protein TNCV_1336411 [Trichonephila clavipes]|nr:uncharacterized protein TNCV_1336411 [Trichonephila clavipes]